MFDSLKKHLKTCFLPQTQHSIASNNFKHEKASNFYIYQLFT